MEHHRTVVSITSIQNKQAKKIKLSRSQRYRSMDQQCGPRKLRANGEDEVKGLPYVGTMMCVMATLSSRAQHLPYPKEDGHTQCAE